MNRVSRLEQDAPPEIREMIAAYRRLTGLDVTLSPDRCHALRMIVERGNPPFGPADLEMVVKNIKRDLNKPRPRFTEASLEFRNLLGDADVFEERALACRQFAARKAGAKPKPPVAVTDSANVTRLLDAPAKEPVPIDGKALAAQFFDMGRKIMGGGK